MVDDPPGQVCGAPVPSHEQRVPSTVARHASACTPSLQTLLVSGTKSVKQTGPPHEAVLAPQLVPQFDTQLVEPGQYFLPQALQLPAEAPQREGEDAEQHPPVVVQSLEVPLVSHWQMPAAHASPAPQQTPLQGCRPSPQTTWFP